MPSIPQAWLVDGHPANGRRVPAGLWARVLFAAPIWWATALWLAIAAFQLTTMERRPPRFDGHAEATVVAVSRYSRGIYATTYTFVDADRRAHAGVSYGSRFTRASPHEVAYASDDPARSCLVGARTRPHDASGGFILFAVSGLMLACLIGTLRTARTTLRLLRHGVHERVKVAERRLVGRSKVTRWQFVFEVADGTWRKVISERGAPEGLVNVVHTPRRAVILETLPLPTAIIGDAIIADRRFWLHLLVAPAIVAVLVALQLAWLVS